LINWGDGNGWVPGSVVQVTPSATGATPYLVVVGSHQFSQAYVNPPLNVAVQVTRTSTGQKPSAYVPISVYGFTAAVQTQPTITMTVDGLPSLVTASSQPAISGTAEPGATIALSYRRLATGVPVSLGSTQANAQGQWSTVIGPLGGAPVALYAVVTSPNGPPTGTIPLLGGLSLYVETQLVNVSKVSPGRNPNTLTVTVSSLGSSGHDPVGHNQASSYTVMTSSGQRLHPVAVSVAPQNPKRPTASRVVTLSFAQPVHSRKLKSNLVVSFPGVANRGGIAALSYH
jgi:hypothetical protein